MKRLSILIAIISCHKNRQRRDEVRKTWLKDLNLEEFDYKFFVGNGKTELEEDVVTLDVDDSYEALPYKVKAVCQYMIDMGYDYVLKIDDDTYMVPNRMFHEVKGHDYVGRHNQTSAAHAPKGFCSGLAYWLSRKAAECLTWAEKAEIIWEDQWAGGWLAKNGITATNDKRYFILSMIARPMWHSFVNQAACFAECRPGELEIIHKMVHGWRPPIEETLPATGKNLRIAGTPDRGDVLRAGSRMFGKDPNLVDPRTGRQFNRTGQVVRRQGRK